MTLYFFCSCINTLLINIISRRIFKALCVTAACDSLFSSDSNKDLPIVAETETQ